MVVSGKVVVVVPCLCDPVGEINILSIHEKGLIEQSGLLQGLLPQEHKCTCQHIHLVGMLSLSRYPRWYFPNRPGLWEKGRESEHLVKGDHGGGEGALGFGKKVSLSIDHFYPQGSGIGVWIHKFDATQEGILFHHRIGIQQQHIPAR